MKRLYERMSIDTWKLIADKVQKLNIYDFTDDEFNENLIMLREMLNGSDIILDYLNRYPVVINEVGFSSLLQAIYSGNVFNDYKKANFYEKIYQLDELGISSIEFRPIDFPTRVDGLSLIKKEKNDEIVGIKSCFTDGEFKIGYPDLPLNRKFDLIDLKDANYLLNVLVDKGIDGNVLNEEESYAVLRNFNGNFPNKEILYELFYPGFSLYSRCLDDGMRQFYLKQIFYPFDDRKAEYTRRLVRSYGNYHYE